MADSVTNDLLVKFVLPGGKPLEGESSTDIELRKCDMSKGFVKGGMFEVDSFQFKTGVGPQDEASTDEQKMREEARNAAKTRNDELMARYNYQLKKGQKVEMPTLEKLPRTTSLGSYSKFRANQDVKYPVDMAPIEFTRAIDKASIALLQNCIDRVNFDSATLIKRKAAGGPAAGEIFLRLDFTKVLVTRVDWDDDNPIKEKCQFITRAVTMHYLPQLPDGSLGASIQSFWTMRPQDYSAVELKKL